MAIITTQGWDLVAVTKQSLLNDLLVIAHQENIFPHKVNVTLSGVTFDGTIGIPSSDLNPAQSSGTNSMAEINAPISGTITFMGQSNIIPPDSSIHIISNLKYVSVTLEGIKKMRLYLDLQSNMAVYTVKVQPSQSWVALLNGIIQYYFQNTYQGGSYYLGTVDMESAPEALRPQGEVYFATQPNTATPNANILALVANTYTGSRGVLSFAENAPLLPAEHHAALFISNRCILNNLLKPILVEQLETPESSFSLTGAIRTPYTLSLNTHIDLPGKYQPKLKQLKVYVNDAKQIQVDYGATGYPLSFDHSDVWVDVDGHFYLSPLLEDQKISFGIDTPKGSGSIHFSALGWAIVQASLLATFGTVSGAIAAIVAIVVPIVITKLKFNISMSSISGHLDQAKTSFDWPAQKECPISAIDLPGDLVLYLNPKI